VSFSLPDPQAWGGSPGGDPPLHRMEPDMDQDTLNTRPVVEL
jgi:hypothetical protein